MSNFEERSNSDHFQDLLLHLEFDHMGPSLAALKRLNKICVPFYYINNQIPLSISEHLTDALSSLNISVLFGITSLGSVEDLQIVHLCPSLRAIDAYIKTWDVVFPVITDCEGSIILYLHMDAFGLLIGEQRYVEQVLGIPISRYLLKLQILISRLKTGGSDDGDVLARVLARYA